MAEARYTAKDSEVYWKPSGGAFAKLTGFKKWSIALTAETAETAPGNTAAAGKTRKVGWKSSVITIECDVQGDNQIDQGDIGDIELLRDLTDASGGYGTTNGKAVCESANIGVDNQGIETVTYTIKTSVITNTVTCGTDAT